MEMVKLAQQVFDNGYQHLVATRHEWVPSTGDLDMELVNHIYRVIIQNHDTNRFVDEFNALVDIQHADGGWGNTSREQESHIRVTAFSAQMLLRANKDLLQRSERLDEAIYRALKFLISHQKEDGTWYDKQWGLYDAVSVNIGTLMFARMLNNVPERIKAIIEAPYHKAMEFLIRTQREDGSWEYKEKYDTPVCVTAHLLQKTVGYGDLGIVASLKAMKYLVQVQHSDGHYDNMNIDHTCDSLRALMLASELLDDFSSHECIDKGFKWLMDNRNLDDGWGDFAGEESNLLIICDGLDTMLKYIRYRKVHDQRTVIS